MTKKICFWSIGDGKYGKMAEVMVHSAKAVGVEYDFHIWTDLPHIEGATVHPCGNFYKKYYMFKFEFLKNEVSKLDYDYFVFLDADNYFVSNPGDMEKIIGDEKVFIQMENEATSPKMVQNNWWSIPIKYYPKFLREFGVTSKKIYNTNAGFWAVRKDAIEEFYDIAQKVFIKAHLMRFKKVTEEPPLACIGHLLQDPEKRTFQRTKHLWASDWVGKWKNILPIKGVKWEYHDWFTAEKHAVCPAIVHGLKFKDAMLKKYNEIHNIKEDNVKNIISVNTLKITTPFINANNFSNISQLSRNENNQNFDEHYNIIKNKIDYIKDDKINIKDKYDITFVMSSVFSNDKYINRFLSTLKNSFLNVKNNKILLFCIHGDYDVPEIIKNDLINIKNIDIIFYRNKYDFNASKLAKFILNYEYINSTYIIRIDDDSITDVGAMKSNLDVATLNKQEFYLTNDHILNDFNKFSQTFIKNNKIDFKLPYLHEWECAMINHNTIKTIQNNKNSMLWITHVNNTNSMVFGDHTWSLAYGLADGKIEKTNFSTQFFNIQNFSVLGGKYAHLHYYGPDFKYYEKANTVIQNILNNNINYTKNEIIYEIFGNTLALPLVIDHDRVYKFIRVEPRLMEFEIMFLKDFTIKSSNPSKCHTYEIYKNNLIIFDEFKNISFIFEIYENTEGFLKGYRTYYEIKEFLLKMTNRTELITYKTNNRWEYF